jgi:hypothetical protein
LVRRYEHQPLDVYATPTIFALSGKELGSSPPVCRYEVDATMIVDITGHSNLDCDGVDRACRFIGAFTTTAR